MPYDDATAQSYGSSPTGSAVPSPPLDKDNKTELEQASKKKTNARNKIGEALSKKLLKISADIENLDREKRLRHVRAQLKAHQYMDGNFFGYLDSNLDWVEASRAPDEVWYTDNQVYSYWRSALMELSRTQTEVVINPAVEGDEDLETAAKFAQARYDANRARTFNARLKQTENSYALLNGITFRYTFPQFSKGARPEKMPILRQNENEEGESTKLCALCLKPKRDLPDIGEGKSPDKCFHCGSDMFNEYSSSGPDTVIGYEDLPQCKNTWIVPNPASVIVSMSASCVYETKFLKWKQMILRCVLEERYKGLTLPSTGTLSPELRYIQDQQRATPGGLGFNGRTANLFDDTTGTKNGSDTNELEELQFDQVWLDYEVYCQWEFEDDMPLPNGKTLKAGKPLGSAYKSGLWFAHTADLVVDMFDECKNRKWTSSPYGMRAGSMYGTGSSVDFNDQDLINDVRRIVMANAWSNGVPREFVNDEVITELSADPQIPTRFKLEAGMPGVLGYGYATAPPMTLSAEVYGLADTAKGDLQNKVGALSSGGATGGLADAQKWGDTATAISIKRDMAVGRFSPDLELMADNLDREQAYQFLENEQEYNTPGDWERLKGPHGENAIEKFKTINIREDLLISITPGSWMPKSDAQMQSKLISFAEILPAVLQSTNPELIAYASEVFGLPDYIGGWATERSATNRLIQRFKMLADMFVTQHGDVPTNDLSPVPSPDGAVNQDGSLVTVDSPTMKAAQLIDQYAGMPVDIFLDDHQAIQDTLKDWRSTDDGQGASNILLATVALRYAKHQAGIAQQQQIMARTAQAGTQPLKDEAEAQGASAQSDAEDGQKLQIAGALADLNDKDANRESKEKMHAQSLASAEKIKQMELDAKAASAKAA